MSKILNFKSSEGSDDKGVISDMMKEKFQKGKSTSSLIKSSGKFNRVDFVPFKNTLSCFVITKDGKRVFTGGFDGNVILRNINDSQKVLQMYSAHNHVRCLTLTDDEVLLASGGSDDNVKIFSAKDLSQISTFKVNSSIFCLEIYNKKKYIFCGAYNGRIFGWNFFTNKPLLHFKTTKKHHDRIVHCLRVHHDTLISCSEDKTVKQWNLQTGKQICVVNFRNPITNLMVIDDTKFLFQHFNNCELYTLRKKKDDASIDKISKNHMFLSISDFTVTDSVLIGWNRLLGRLQFYDIENKSKLFDTRIYDSVFLRNIVCVSHSNIRGEKIILSPLPNKKISSFRNQKRTHTDLRAIKKGIKEKRIKGERKSLDDKDVKGFNDSMNFFVYYLVGKYLDRKEVNLVQQKLKSSGNAKESDKNN